jgi:hypothetical protein
VFPEQAENEIAELRFVFLHILVVARENGKDISGKYR